MTRKITAVILVSFLALIVHAKEFKDVTMPDEIKVGDTTLMLNGMGLRRFLVFNVYVGGLYLPQKSSSADEILKMTGPKRVVLHFKRFVEKGKMEDAWKEGFDKNADPSYSYSGDLNKLKELMSHLQKDDEIIMTFFADHADVQVKDKPVATIQGADFSKTLLKVFINNPPDEDLRDGLLGKK
jgi:hypothetical protein